MFWILQTGIPRWDQCCNPGGIQKEQHCTLIQQNSENQTKNQWHSSSYRCKCNTIIQGHGNPETGAEIICYISSEFCNEWRTRMESIEEFSLHLGLAVTPQQHSSRASILYPFRVAITDFKDHRGSKYATSVTECPKRGLRAPAKQG